MTKGNFMSNFNLQYHRKILVASNTEHHYIKEAVSMLDKVEQAMLDLINVRINVEKYIELITPYDQFMYERAKMKPQKSNPINTLQNKKYSSWREQKWASIFELVRQELVKIPKWKDTNLVVIQNKPIVESVYSNGYTPFKDVDGGLAIEIVINGKLVLIPVIAVEDKGGHACSTCFNSVNAQGLRLHQSFPAAKTVFITDNNISVGSAKGTEIADHINLIVCERGKNSVKENYPQLRHDRFSGVKDALVSKLSSMDPNQFTKYRIIESNSTTKLRDPIDKLGILINW